MKRIFYLISVVFYAMMMEAQDMYLKMETDTWSDKYTYYNYDEDWKLESIIVVYTNDTLETRLYSNDTLVKKVIGNSSRRYYYQGDSVLYFQKEPNGSYYLSHVYYLNENNEVTHDNKCNAEGNYTYTINHFWENGNCVKASYENISESHFFYNKTIVNPYYNENKYFKKSFSGSNNIFNFADFEYFTKAQIVLSSKNGYPLEVDFYSSEGYSNLLLYEYYDLTDVNDAIMDDIGELLEIRYYNLFGQEIQKPAKGFFIEKKKKKKRDDK